MHNFLKRHMDYGEAQQRKELIGMGRGSIKRKGVGEMETNQARKHFSSIGLICFLATLVICGAQYGVMALVAMWQPEWLENPDYQLVVSMAPMYLVGIPVWIFLLKRLPEETIVRRKMSVGKLLIACTMGYAVMYCGNLVGTVLTLIIGLLKGSLIPNDIQQIAMSTSLPLNILFMVICAPIIEELIFRKLLIDRTVQYGEGTAILLSGLMFGLFHGNINQFIYAFPLGLLLAFIYVKTGNVKYTMILHAVVNFFGGVAGVWILRNVDYENMMNILLTTDPAEMMSVIFRILPGWLLLMGYVVVVLAMAITGVVLLIVFHKRFTLSAAKAPLPKGKFFSVVFCNPGMAAYSIFWLGMIIWNLIR